MASIWFLKALHAQEQESDQSINMKYASWSLSSSWYVWGNPVTNQEASVWDSNLQN